MTIDKGELYYKAFLEHGSYRAASKALGLSKETVRRGLKNWLEKNNIKIELTHKYTNKDKKKKQEEKKLVVEFPSNKKLETGGIKRYIITCAQNNTPLTAGIWATLKAAAKHLKAELVVIPLLYKNPTGYCKLEIEQINWPAEILPHTIHEDLLINEDWMILGGLHIQTTAAQPLAGLSGISYNRSGVVGHPRIDFKSRPVPPGSKPICHITTGSISEPVYSDTKVGQLAKFHHSSGAVLVETNGEETFVRHLRYDHKDKSIIDIDTKYTAEGKKIKGQYIDGVVFGDLHEWFSPHTDFILNFCKKYSPKNIFLHDALDSFSISHHHKGNPFLQLAKGRVGYDRLIDEVASLVGFHNDLTEAAPKSQLVYVDSNHCDQHIMRWLKESDWRTMGLHNASEYLKLASIYVTSLRDTEVAYKMVSRGTMGSPLKLLMTEQGADLSRTKLLGKDEMFSLHGIEHGLHGHQGPNGSRGSTSGFVKTQAKINKGHAHTADITNNVYTAGTSGPLQAEYTGGPSSWSRAHIITYSNGKRTLFTCSDSRFRITEEK